jgi:hypothetical protein
MIEQMSPRWIVHDLNVDRLLESWRWLCPQTLTLLDRNAFGDLFLRDEDGAVFRLDVAGGSFSKVAQSEAQFFDLATMPDKREEWFAEVDTKAAAERGLTPGAKQCIGFSVPLVFAESGSPETAYVADLYDVVGFLGDLHRQIATLPDGSKVRLRVK